MTAQPPGAPEEPTRDDAAGGLPCAPGCGPGLTPGGGEGAASGADASHAAKSGAVQLLAALGQGMLAIYQFVVSRLFGAATYGVYMTSVGIVEVLMRGGLFGADKAMLRYIAAHRVGGEPELEMRAFGSGLRASAVTAALMALGLVAVAGRIAQSQGKPELSLMLRVMAPAVITTSAMMILVAATLGAKLVRYNLYVRGLAEPGFLLLAAGAAALLGGGSGRLATAHLLATCLTCTAAFLACARVFGARRAAAALVGPGHPELVRFAYPIAASEMLNAVLQRADVILLGFFVGRVDVGIYAAAEFLGRFIANARYAFDSVACPVLSEALTLKDRERLRYNLALMTRWVSGAAAPACAVIVALGPELLALYGEHFVTGISVLVVLAANHLVNGSMGLTPWVLVMSGRSRLMFFNNLGAALLNVLLNLLLIPRLGLVGAAASALVSVTALQIAYGVEVWILERVHCFGLPLLKPYLAAGVMLAAQLGVRALVANTAARVAAVIVVGLVAYLGTYWVLRPAPEERELVAKALRKLGLRR